MPSRKKPVPDEIADDITEITKMSAPRIDLVHGPANGIGFLLAKSSADPSIFTEGDIAALAKRSEEGDSMTDPTDDTLEKDVEIDVTPDTDLEVPEVDADGDAVLDPASPAWEALDAARAAQAIELTVALRRLVEQAAERESQEAIVGDDPDDAENAWSLSTVLDDLDCILGVLAPFAVSEAAEAEDRQADDELVLKSGRVLSGINEGKIQQAHDLLSEVLVTVAAPDQLTKAEDTDDAEASDGKPQQLLVYGPKGAAAGPLGSINPDDLTTFVNSANPDDTDTDDVSDAEDSDADAEAAADAAPETPEDPAETQIPGTDTVQAPAEDEEDVKKGLAAEFRTALGEALEPVVKQLGVVPELATALEDLQKRVESIGRQPDDRTSPRLNGATGAAFVARAPEQDDALADLRKAVDDASPAEKPQRQAELAYATLRGRFENR